MEDNERYWQGSEPSTKNEGFCFIQIFEETEDEDGEVKVFFEYSSDTTMSDTEIVRYWFDHTIYDSIQNETIEKYLKKYEKRVFDKMLDSI